MEGTRLAPTPVRFPCECSNQSAQRKKRKRSTGFSRAIRHVACYTEGMQTSLRLLTTEIVPERLRRQFHREIPELQWIQSRGEFVAEDELAHADIFFGLFPSETRIPPGRLRWIQYAFAGIPEWLCPQVIERDILLTNASGIYDRTISEHVVAVMLAMARRIDFYCELRTKRTWAHPVNPRIEDLAGSTAAIVGMGSLGQATARLLKQLGMRVVGCRRTPRWTPYLDQLFPVDRILEMVAQARWLVIATPLTRETRGLVSDAVLSAMPPGSRVVNVGRGAVLDTRALLHYLESSHLAGAALDVTEEEPLAPDHPLWTAPNVILTQHSSSNPADASTAAAELLLRNIHRYLDGETLENVVDPRRGY